MKRLFAVCVLALAACLLAAPVAGAAAEGAGAPAEGSKPGKGKKKPGKCKKKGKKGKGKGKGKKGDAKKGKGKKKKCKKPKKPGPLRIAILDAGQNLLTAGDLKVRVVKPRTNRPVKVWLGSGSETFDEGFRTLAPDRRLSFGRKAAKREVVLDVTPEAAAAAASCQRRSIVVEGKMRNRLVQARADMARQSAACQLPPVDMSRAQDCDFIADNGGRVCMMPFPNDYYTKDDPSTATGKRIAFTAGGMPKNASGKPIDPADYRASDGFSQGTGIVLKVPGINTQRDVVETNDMVPINHLGEYMDVDQKVVVIDARTGQRWPVWAEIDSHATSGANAALEILPAKNFESGGRYIVALRNLVTGSGQPIEAPPAFRYFRDEMPSDQARINDRRPHFEDMFTKLRSAGIKRSELYLAWDFTVASDQNNYRRALSLRDKAFASIGDTTMADEVVQGDAPDFQVDEVYDESSCDPADSECQYVQGNDHTGRLIIGTYTVPCFMTPSCESGGVLNLGPDGLPVRNGNYEANFECIVPERITDGEETDPIWGMVFGHGLFGAADGVRGSVNPQLADEYGYVICGTDEIGMAGQDIDSGMVPGALANLSNFEQLPDRLQQGLTNELFLARLMFHPDGFGTADPFHMDGTGGTPSAIRTDDVFYMGASQGGIMGGALTAISPDFTQSSLLVGGMNYSLLLRRSVDYVPFAFLLNASYPNELDRPVIFNLIQMLWDRGEPNGYAHVMTQNPPPNTPKHNLTLMLALGDHQVTNYAGENQARTLGLKTHDPVIDPGRWPNYDILWGVERLTDADYPYRGSSIIYLDGGPMRPNPDDPDQIIGTPPPPFENVPNDLGEDPHGAPRGADAAVEMTATMLRPNGYIEDVCGDDPCYGGGWDGSLP